MKNEKTKKKINVGVIVFIIICIIVVAGIGFVCYKLIKADKTTEEVSNVASTLNEIEGYGITLSDKDTELYKSEYLKLKDNLESKSINYDDYAASIAKLFVIDLYTIDNKINTYDIGGVEFVYPDVLDNYKLNVDDTIYKYVEDNSKNTRTQVLPEVSSISIDKTTKGKYKINSENTSYDSYTFELTWKYVKDLGYDAKGEVIVINKDNKMYVVEKN